MSHKSHANLSRRERQIMDIVYREMRVSASGVLTQLPDPPSYSAVRAMLRVLVDKGHLRHEMDGNRYIYLPTMSRTRASESALENVLQTFFDGSTEGAVAALLDMSRSDLSDDDLDRMASLIERARQEGR